MAAEQRKLLEQLMGDQFSGSASARNANLTLTDPKICRSYLVGTCPHDLFTNTKQDLGPCPKVHSENLKIEYDGLSAAEKSKLGFEYDYMRDMQKYIDECNRRIDAAQRRLEKTPDEIRQTNALLKTISDLSKTINTGLLEVSILGETGAVGLASMEFHKVRVAKQAREQAERDLKALSDTSGPSGHQKLQVCDVCGAYLSRLDNDRRLADHFYGKMHLGYAQMRKTYEALQKESKGRAPPVRPEDGSPGGPRGGYDDGPGYGDGGWGGRGGFGGRGGYRGGGGFRGRGRGGGGYGRW
jgi:LUC7 N_terminus